jgi:hypothetical protein
VVEGAGYNNSTIFSRRPMDMNPPLIKKLTMS